MEFFYTAFFFSRKWDLYSSRLLCYEDAYFILEKYLENCKLKIFLISWSVSFSPAENEVFWDCSILLRIPLGSASFKKLTYHYTQEHIPRRSLNRISVKGLFALCRTPPTMCYIVFCLLLFGSVAPLRSCKVKSKVHLIILKQKWGIFLSSATCEHQKRS